jgi:hypothetical protein
MADLHCNRCYLCLSRRNQHDERDPGTINQIPIGVFDPKVGVQIRALYEVKKQLPIYLDWSRNKQVTISV